MAARISACLTEMYWWMKDHHLQLNRATTGLLVVTANQSLHHNFTFQLGSSSITSSKTARNLGVVIDDQFNFSNHIAKTAQSCRFASYNIIKISPFLSCCMSRVDVTGFRLQSLWRRGFASHCCHQMSRVDVTESS